MWRLLTLLALLVGAASATHYRIDVTREQRLSTRNVCVGDTVEWVNRRSAPLSVISDGCPFNCHFTSSGAFSSRFSHTFAREGRFDYHSDVGEPLYGAVQVNRCANERDSEEKRHLDAEKRHHAEEERHLEEEREHRAFERSAVEALREVRGELSEARMAFQRSAPEFESNSRRSAVARSGCGAWMGDDVSWLCDPPSCENTLCAVIEISNSSQIQCACTTCSYNATSQRCGGTCQLGHGCMEVEREQCQCMPCVPSEEPAVTSLVSPSPTSLLVEWEAGAGTPTRDFIVEWRASGAPTWEEGMFLSNATFTYLIQGLEPSTQYEVRVRAISECGSTAYSGVEGAPTLASAPTTATPTTQAPTTASPTTQAPSTPAPSTGVPPSEAPATFPTWLVVALAVLGGVMFLLCVIGAFFTSDSPPRPRIGQESARVLAPLVPQARVPQLRHRSLADTLEF